METQYIVVNLIGFSLMWLILGALVVAVAILAATRK